METGIRVVKVGSRLYTGRRGKWRRKVRSCCQWASYEGARKRSCERELECRTPHLQHLVQHLVLFDIMTNICWIDTPKLEATWTFMSDQNTVKIRTYLWQIAVLSRFSVSSLSLALCLSPNSIQHCLQMAKGPQPVEPPHGEAVSSWRYLKDSQFLLLALPICLTCVLLPQCLVLRI